MTPSVELEEDQQDRYSRQLMIDAITEAEQRRLLESRVLVAGAGGLGSAAIQYLAAAGVGTVGIADGGAVTRSNLHRQVIHRTADIGTPKVESAARYVADLNPDVEVMAYDAVVDPELAQAVVPEYDLVVDGLDNFQGRFLLNDVARLAGVPFVHGAVFGFEGQVAAFVPDGPCYRCLLPAVPTSSAIPSGEPMGIFPTLPGVIGCLEATEALKLLTGVGDPIVGRIVRVDGYDGTVVASPLAADPACPVCGDEPVRSIDGIDYDGDCRIDA